MPFTPDSSLQTTLADSADSNAPPKKRLLLVDDHPVFRHGISQFLSSFDDLVVCGEAADSKSALDAVRRLLPEVVLLDVCLPGINGIELTKLILAEQPKLLILVLSMHDDSLYALRALRAGAKGYLMKEQPMESIREALVKIMSGGIYISPQFSEKLVFRAIEGSESDFGLPVDRLSDRELEVLHLFGNNRSTREIADALHLSIKTVETHRSHIKDKLGFKSATEMVRFAEEWVEAERSH